MKKGKKNDTTKRVRARASKSLTPQYLASLTIIFSHLSLAIRNLFMIEYLENNPDTTTEEFDQVWRTINPEIKDVCSSYFSPLLLLTPLQIWDKKSKAAKSGATLPDAA